MLKLIVENDSKKRPMNYLERYPPGELFAKALNRMAQTHNFLKNQKRPSSLLDGPGGVTVDLRSGIIVYPNGTRQSFMGKGIIELPPSKFKNET